MRKYIIIAGGLLLPMLATAKVITPAEAMARAAGNVPTKIKSAGVSGMRLCSTQPTTTGEPGVYLYANAGGGYIILSADDATVPVLGYSDNGILGSELPAPMQWWIEEYARQIEYVRAHEGKQPTGAALALQRPDRDPIAPMLQTSWDQDEPYYNMCPMGGTERTYTGCVATAMAQVMKYWEYPAKGAGSISYDAESIQKRLELNFALRSFDWENMLPTYTPGNYTQQEADAVAYLMKACGYAVKMDYGTDSSGALSMAIPRAFTKYFKYDSGVREELRQYYSLTEWENLMYDQLANVGPVLYGGGSIIGGGHSFVCDGYDTDGYFHFNWGWTGMSNGYYLLDALNPYATGIGGGQGGGYNFTQDAIIGIQPPVEGEHEERVITLSQNGSFAGYLQDGMLYFDLFAEGEAMYVNYEPTTLKLMMGVIIEAENVEGFESYGTPMADIHFSLDPGYGTAPSYFKGGVKLSDLNLPDGTYKLTAATLLDGEGNEWVPCRTGREYFNYLYLTRAGNQYSVEVMGVDRLEVQDGGVKGELYYGTYQKVYIKVHNYADHEMSRGFAPVIMIDGETKMLGESIMLTVPAGETVEREWTTYLYSLDPYFNIYADKDVQFTFFDESTYNFFTDDLNKTLTMHANPGAPDIVTKSAPVIVNGIRDKSVPHPVPTYVTAHPEELEVEVNLRLKSGYFGYPVYAVIIKPSSYDIIDYMGYEVFMSEPNEEQTFKVTVPFTGAEENTIYEVMIGFSYGSQMYQIPSHTCMFLYDPKAGSSVETLCDDADEITYDGRRVKATGNITLYTVDGKEIKKGENSLDTYGLEPGLYLVQTGKKGKKITIRNH